MKIAIKQNQNTHIYTHKNKRQTTTRDNTTIHHPTYVIIKHHNKNYNKVCGYEYYAYICTVNVYVNMTSVRTLLLTKMG